MSWQKLKKGRYSKPFGEYFITFTCHNRHATFIEHHLAKRFCQSISYNEQQHDCSWLAWVLMPDHFHGLVRLGNTELGKVVGHLKGYSSHMINQCVQGNSKVWQGAYYDRALRAEEQRIAIARYIVANPLRAGLVTNIWCYPYWNSVYL